MNLYGLIDMIYRCSALPFLIDASCQISYLRFYNDNENKTPRISKENVPKNAWTGIWNENLTVTSRSRSCRDAGWALTPWIVHSGASSTASYECSKKERLSSLSRRRHTVCSRFRLLRRLGLWVCGIHLSSEAAKTLAAAPCRRQRTPEKTPQPPLASFLGIYLISSRQWGDLNSLWIPFVEWNMGWT